MSAFQQAIGRYRTATGHGLFSKPLNLSAWQEEALMKCARERRQALARELDIAGKSWLEVCELYPQLAKDLRPLYLGMLNALDIKNANAHLRLPRRPKRKL